MNEAAADTLGIATGPLRNAALTRVLLETQHGVLPVISSLDRDSHNIRDRLAALWGVLIPEKERTALTDGSVKLLSIIPSGPLSLLPFETLVVDDESDSEYLLDVGPPIAYAPSAAVLLNLSNREQTQASAAEPVLTLGDPEYSVVAAAESTVDRQLGIERTSSQFRSSLAPLPFTGQEAAWLKAHFEKREMSCIKLTGGQATERQVRQLINGREIIHLACHGMADQSYGNFFGALALTPGRKGDPRDDGFLSMSEIYELDLDGCELAILSACQTNYGPQQEGEGVWALSRGFLVAGARRVVASNWVVDDKAGAYLISYFGDYLSRAGKDASSRDYASALQKAKRLIRKREEWSDPFFWSGLVLVGPN